MSPYPITRWLLALGLACGALPPAAAGSDDACSPWRAVPIPVADTGAGMAPANCSAAALYYGVDGRGGDPVAARHCAYQERAAAPQTATFDPVFGSSGILMMLYANGQGIAQDLPLARRFACEYGGAPAELRGRLWHLARIADGSAPAALDICDDITSGLMSGHCAARNADVAQAEREHAWQALLAGWSPRQRRAWDRLRDAADAYFRLAAREEVDMSGTARAAMVIEARESLEVTLLADVRAYAQGAPLPRPTWPPPTGRSMPPIDGSTPP